MTVISTVGTLYAFPPQQAEDTSIISVRNKLDQELIAGMSLLQAHDRDNQQVYMPGNWKGSLGFQRSNNDPDGYVSYQSPAASCLQQPSSTQTSPRSWDSPEQLGPTNLWDSAPECFHSQYFGLDSNASYRRVHNNGADSAGSPPRDSVSVIPVPLQASLCHAVPKEAVYPATPESSEPVSPDTTTSSMAVDTPEEDVTRSPDNDDEYSQTPAAVEDGGDNRRSNSNKSYSSIQGQKEGEKEEPYAKLIHRAFMSTPRRAMTLQEIYQWFRENTDKDKSGDKGWQNSIRHNLSMNQAFTKRERRNSGSASSGTQIETRKSTEWYLEPWAFSGVQSTTRYRKDNQSRRNAANSGALSSRSCRGYPASHHASLGKKGGRVLRGARSAARGSVGSIPKISVAHSPQHQQQLYRCSPHHTTTGTASPINHRLANDVPITSTAAAAVADAAAAVSGSSAYGDTSHQPFFTHPQVPEQGQNLDSSGTMGLDYSYPDPQQLFPTTTTASSPSASSSVATPPSLASVAGGTTNEPGYAGPADESAMQESLRHHPHLLDRSPYGSIGIDQAGAPMVLTDPLAPQVATTTGGGDNGTLAATVAAFSAAATCSTPISGIMSVVTPRVLYEGGGDYHHHHHHHQQQTVHSIPRWDAGSSPNSDACVTRMDGMSAMTSAHCSGGSGGGGGGEEDSGQASLPVGYGFGQAQGY